MWSWPEHSEEENAHSEEKNALSSNGEICFDFTKLNQQAAALYRTLGTDVRPRDARAVINQIYRQLHKANCGDPCENVACRCQDPDFREHLPVCSMRRYVCVMHVYTLQQACMCVCSDNTCVIVCFIYYQERLYATGARKLRKHCSQWNTSVTSDGSLSHILDLKCFTVTKKYRRTRCTHVAAAIALDASTVHASC